MASLPSGSVDAIITSPPYYSLRDYGVAGQIGLEETPQAYVCRLVEVFNEARRVLRDDGTLWLNLGDSYAANRSYQVVDSKHIDVGNNGPMRVPEGLKPKDLIGIPWRVAFALQAAGWYLRSEIIWHKPNAMPESVTDRPTKAHEQIFLLAKSERYYYDIDAIREPCTEGVGWRKSHKVKQFGGSGNGELIQKHDSLRMGEHPNGRNRRSVWTQATRPYKGAHFATFPPDLIRPCVRAGCRPGGTVLDPFFGAGTTGVVCVQEGRGCIGIELNESYFCIAQDRITDAGAQGMLSV